MRAKDGVLFFICLIMLFAASGCDYNTATVEDEQKDPYFMKGKDQLARRDVEGAQESFMQALERNPRNSAAHYELGILSEESKQDYVGAIYHYQRYLQLAGPNGEDQVIRGRVTACKRALVTQSGITPDGAELERKLEQEVAKNENLQITLKRMTEDFSALKTENNELRARLVQSAAQSPGGVVTGNVPAAPVAHVSGATPAAAGSVQSLPGVTQRTVTPQAAKTQPQVQTYKIMEGDSFQKIARKLNVKTKEITDLNPKVDPRKLQIGQEIKVPVH